MANDDPITATDPFGQKRVVKGLKRRGLGNEVDVNGLKHRGLRTGSLRNDVDNHFGMGDDKYSPISRSEEAIVVRIHPEEPVRTNLQLSPIRFKDDEGYVVIHEPGAFTEVYPQEAGPTLTLDVFVDGVSLSADPPPELGIEAGQAVYLHFKTNEKGKLEVITEADEENDVAEVFIELIADAPGKESTFYEIPDEFGNGVKGDYYIELYRVEEVSGNIRVDEGSPRRYGNYDWARGYEALHNIGENNIYSHYDLATDFKELRGIGDGYGIQATTTPFNVRNHFRGENRGDPEDPANAIEVFIEEVPPGDETPGIKAGFRTLTQGPAGRRQITVKENGDLGQIYGNDVTGELSITEEGSDASLFDMLLFQDGLVTDHNDLTSVELDICDDSSGSPVIRSIRVVTVP